MMVSNRDLLFQGSIFRCYVSFREGKLPTLGVDVAAAPSDPWWLFRCFFTTDDLSSPLFLSSEIWHISWEVLPIFFEEDFCSDDSNSDYKSGGCVFLYKAMVTVTFSCFLFNRSAVFIFRVPRKPIQNLPWFFDGGMDPTLEVRWQPKKDTRSDDCGLEEGPFCWWFRNPTNYLGCIKPVVNNGIFTISTDAGFLPSTVSLAESALPVTVCLQRKKLLSQIWQFW